MTIDRGTGSQKTIELVATGTYDLGYGDINSMIEYNVKNPGNPLVGVYMVLNTPPFSLLSLKKYGVKQPKDLKGFSIGAPAGDAPRRLWPIFAKNVGLARGQRDLDQHGAAAPRAGPRQGRRQGHLRLLLHRAS